MTHRPLRILLISNKCPPDFDGGYELRAFQIAQALRARGHDLDLVTSRYRPSYEGERRDPPWVHRILRYVLPSRFEGMWRKVDRVIQFVKGVTVAEKNIVALDTFLECRDYDVAYCFAFSRIGFATASALTRKGIPILWHAGDATLPERLIHWPRKIPGYDLALRLLAGRCWALEKSGDYANIAVVSDFLRVRFAGCGLGIKRLFVISRGIAFPLLRDVERGRASPPTLFMASRLDPQKGIHHAIAACGLLSRRRPELPWRLEIAGQAMTPGYLEELKRLAHSEGIAERVHFLGRLSHHDVLARMADATAFLFCSVYGEPFSSTIIEALACGTPLVGSDDGSILEVVEDERSALIYPKNDPVALSSHLERILEDSSLRTTLACEGLAIIEQRYTIDRIMELTEDSLHEVAGLRSALLPALA